MRCQIDERHGVDARSAWIVEYLYAIETRSVEQCREFRKLDKVFAFVRVGRKRSRLWKCCSSLPGGPS